MFEESEKRRRGRPKKTQPMDNYPELINFDGIQKLKDLYIDPRMFEQMKSGLIIDDLISHESGIPSGTNIMCIGDPGVGKTTLLLDLVSAVQNQNKDKRCLFISGEMGKKQMFKYTQRMPQFGIVETLFVSDYTDYNTKDVIEQLFNKGFDLVLIDSVAEVLDGVRTDNGWDRKTAEAWLVDLCNQNNKGENETSKFTTFILIQQVTKGGVFVGSNKLKHLVDSFCEMRREKESDGGGTYLNFVKNRNGNVDMKLYFQLTGKQIIYTNLKAREEEEDTE
jgi:predicted ATP-dependent serine protease